MVPAINLAKYELNQARLRTQVSILRKLGKFHDDELTLHRDGIRSYYTLTFNVWSMGKLRSLGYCISFTNPFTVELSLETRRGPVAQKLSLISFFTLLTQL